MLNNLRKMKITFLQRGDNYKSKVCVRSIYLYDIQSIWHFMVGYCLLFESCFLKIGYIHLWELRLFPLQQSRLLLHMSADWWGNTAINTVIPVVDVGKRHLHFQIEIGIACLHFLICFLQCLLEGNYSDQKSTVSCAIEPAGSSSCNKDDYQVEMCD